VNEVHSRAHPCGNRGEANRVRLEV
jgi:hypothetical protein